MEKEYEVRAYEGIEQVDFHHLKESVDIEIRRIDLNIKSIDLLYTNMQRFSALTPESAAIFRDMHRGLEVNRKSLQSLVAMINKREREVMAEKGKFIGVARSIGRGGIPGMYPR